MNTAVINVNPTIKKQAQGIAAEIGVSLSTIVNKLLRQFVATKIVQKPEVPSSFLKKALKESKADIKAGRVSPSFDNADDAIRWLNDPHAKYVYQLQQKVQKATK